MNKADFFVYKTNMPSQAFPHSPLDPGIRLLVCLRMKLDRWSHENLSAPYWRLYRNAQSGAWVKAGGKRVPLDPGAVFLIPPDTPFASGLERPVRHLFIHFSFPSIHENGSVIYRFPVRPEWRGLISRVEKSSDYRPDKSAGHPFETGLDAVALVCLALRQVPVDRFRARFGEPRIDRVIAWMSERLSEPCSAVERGRVAGLHPVALARLFREVTGRSPATHLRLMRVREACLLLHHTELSVDDIAERTGFCDRFHFSRVFRTERGVGPASFRKQRTGI